MELFKEYHGNGKVKREMVKSDDGVAEFYMRDYYDDGMLKQEIPWVGGRWHGTVIAVDRIGHKETTTYKQGLICGPWELVFNGKKVMSHLYGDTKLSFERAG